MLSGLSPGRLPIYYGAMWPRCVATLAKPCQNKGKMVQLTGDLDIFGDGSVVVRRWVGHTPGSQMLLVGSQRAVQSF